MKKILFGLIVLNIFLPINVLAFTYPSAKITVKAVDEQGHPLEGADVSVSFVVSKSSGWGSSQIDRNGQTDKKGIFTVESNSSHKVGFTVDKKGYYQSGQGYVFEKKSLLNRWEPWNPTVEVVLKKKRNPVPMYMKGTHGMKIPEFDKLIGFDLEKGDWVAPYGKGIVSDFIFNMHVKDRAYTDYDCNFTLTFSNEYDGIQEYFFDSSEQSLFMWPFEAPVEGYIGKILKEKSISLPETGYKSNENKNVHYIFRVRTKVDEKGNIIEANYGKISKEFEFDPKGAIFFSYYFSPDGTRNLEEDPEKNLFDIK